ncbi:hypothetical protein SDC9_158761 [bioreactor metagenome]|uniref:VanZ-like domain-containing protein n=1 Tax=bioreactor metagenome TaxID=1076179 RepID=A0A645FC20_9ZZZZ
MNSVVINIVGNIIAFTPFAFFLPLFFKKLRSFSRFLLAMICIVSTVELLQFVLLAGSCDIDDVILNVGGSCMAYGILHIGFFSRIIEKITLLQYRNERKFPRISEHN